MPKKSPDSRIHLKNGIRSRPPKINYGRCYAGKIQEGKGKRNYKYFSEVLFLWLEAKEGRRSIDRTLDDDDDDDDDTDNDYDDDDGFEVP